MRRWRLVLAALCATLMVAAAHVTERPQVTEAASPPAELISPDPNGDGYSPYPDGQSTLSGDGLLVSYSIDYPNASSFTRNVMVRNRVSGTTTAVPFTDDTRGGTMSRDGCVIAFWGFVVVVEFFFWRLETWNRCTGGPVVGYSEVPGSTSTPYDDSVSLSADGSQVAWATGDSVVGVTDTGTHTTKIISGQPGAPGPAVGTFDRIDLSDDGNTVVYSGSTGRLSESVYAWTRGTNKVDLVSVNGTTSLIGGSPTVSADGRYVAFVSCATLKDNRVLTVRDRTAKVTKFIAPPGGDLVGNAYLPDMTPDGTQIAVVYNGLTGCVLVGARGHQVAGVVRTTAGLYDQVQAETVSYGVDGQAVGYANDPTISSTGRWVTFDSFNSAQLLGVDNKGSLDVWARERPPRLTAPTKLDLGGVPVGATTPPKVLQIRNSSNAIVPIVSIVPPGSGFHVIADGCTGVALQPAASCPLTIVFTPAAVGPASSPISVNGDGTTVTTTLLGAGTIQIYNPTLQMNPGVVVSGDVTFAVGAGFPPNSPVSLLIDGVVPVTVKAPIVSDGTGAFRVAVVVLVTGAVRVGGHQVLALDTPNYSGVRAPLLVQLGSFQPAASLNPAFLTLGPSVVSMVSRSG